jgi:hypothetical protein
MCVCVWEGGREREGGRGRERGAMLESQRASMGSHLVPPQLSSPAQAALNFVEHQQRPRLVAEIPVVIRSKRRKKGGRGGKEEEARGQRGWSTGRDEGETFDSI